jgi:hypothetical protein
MDKTCLVTGLVILLGAAVASAATVEPVPFKVPAKLPDLAVLPSPSDVQLTGYLGQRVAASEKNRLLVVDEEELLAGFRHRPGKQDWIGEHVGKFLHAATLAWANTGDPQLRAKIDRVAAELIKCQMPDGYLGTYTPERHWTSWDVWVHKYDLLGLLTYYQYTGDTAALDASKKIGDLLVNTFGPGKKSIISAGTHVGMAATSVLEPIVYLYRMTGDERYLDFAKYIVAAYDEPNGPKIVKTLTEVGKVNQTANGKAYEMMSNLVGLCELARVTGDRALLQAAENAWKDVVTCQLYITGSASHGEHFGRDFDLPNDGKSNICETCVTVTWIQLTAQLLRLTGDTKYADELERSYYNHLAGAQLPDGSKWAYYTPLEGTKPYGNATNCCLSSGPRGMALAPTLVYSIRQIGGRDFLDVNLYEASRATLQLGGHKVTVEQKTNFPRSGEVTLTFTMDQPTMFGVGVRKPVWAKYVRVGPELTKAMLGGEGKRLVEDFAAARVMFPALEWKSGDSATISLPMECRVIAGDHGNAGKFAVEWGPTVLAYDESRNKGLPPASRIALAQEETLMLGAIKLKDGPGLELEVPIRTASGTAKATFVPFAEAGAEGGRFRVWLPMELPKPSESLLMGGRESRSRPGNLNASITDDDPATHVVTFGGAPPAEDWFAVTLDAPATVKRIVVMHGRAFHDGGWFDASAAKPRIEVLKEKGGAWEVAGTLDDYPPTTAAKPQGLKDGQAFTLKLKEPLKVFGVRVIGRPAAGDNPQTAFASCAELQAFAE